MTGYIISKMKCRECNWHGKNSEVLSAPNPFDPSNILIVCPTCKQVECLAVVCDEPGCWSEISCGTPTADEYRSTCGKHKPNVQIEGLADTALNKGDTP